LFDHRLAALLGRTVGEMRATLPWDEYCSWLAYWQVEPWGPWRDNVHAAIIAREVTRANPRLRRGAKLDLASYMVIDPEQRQRAANERVVSMLQAMAVMGERRGH
jgi:hypothetical protein